MTSVQIYCLLRKELTWRKKDGGRGNERERERQIDMKPERGKGSER